MVYSSLKPSQTFLLSLPGASGRIWTHAFWKMNQVLYHSATAVCNLRKTVLLSPCDNGRIQAHDFRIMIQMLYHCATTTCNLQKLFVPSLSVSSRIRTCSLVIMRQVFYYCATASGILNKPFPELIFCENIFKNKFYIFLQVLTIPLLQVSMQWNLFLCL